MTIVIHSVATVELEEKFYQVNESDGFVEVCAVVKLPVVGCPIAAPFSVLLTTNDESAGQLTVYKWEKSFLQNEW